MQLPHLQKLNKREEAPLDSYIFYDLNGGIYAVRIEHYSDFLLHWVGLQDPPAFTMDLAFASPHSLILDFDCVQHTPENGTIFDTICALLKRALLPTVSHFTYLVCLRRGGRGVHVHLPEFKIGHDDYILLCKHLQEQFSQVRKDYHLDILANAMLSGAKKPNTPHPYIPTRLQYADERQTHLLHLNQWEEDIVTLRKNFPKRKDTENSLFRSLLNSDYTLLLNELKQLMMPVTLTSTTPLAYATVIGKVSADTDSQTVAHFLLQHSEDILSVVKSKKLAARKVQPLKVYHYLQHNASNMSYCRTDNHAIKMWFERFSHSMTATDDSHIPSFFRDVHRFLQYEHMTLAQDPNPIKTTMQFNRGYYFLPVFYALCQHYGRDSRWMADCLTELLDTEFHPLLKKIAAVNPKNIQFAVNEISINSIHFCANNLHETAPRTYREKLKSIVENNRRAILSVSTHDQMVELLRTIQERHLPIRVLKMKNALKRPNRHIWNALTESWQEIGMVSEVSDHMTNLWHYIKQYMREYWDSGGRGGPDVDLVQKFNVASVVAAIMSDTAMEQKNIQMDTHKWFLRLEDGVLDLLTGHIGGVVPEFFISNRTIDLGIPRPRMMELCNETPRLYVDLYEQLVDKTFFMQYLKSLFLDRTAHLLDTLQDLVPGTEGLATSMLHFYVNLCKCTCFEYDLMMYMLDVLASVLVGTNYERKFFVWKGLTRNGKSKLFELMGRVLGGYYHSIQSENLTPNHSTNTATPELASTLFSCRMVTSEELEKKLDENRVKQITGNSFVAFRNMYEQNMGGIPTAKLFATTNNYPECKASEAFKDRVVAIPFEAEFTDSAPATTSEQVARNVYAKDVYVVQQSFQGCFLMLYYHLKKHMKVADDALLHYRDEPECVKEFTYDYLIHADIYVQFKLYMDVQLMAGYVTSMNEVKSAVRQYLKTTKNTSYHETDLFICFEKEFGDLRKTDVYLGGPSCSSIVDDPKRPRYEASVVFYEGVIIKNLKRTTLDT